MQSDESEGKGKTRVRVAMRVRPMSEAEAQHDDRAIIKWLSPTQIHLTSQRQYTFDHVYGEDSTQECIYRDCVQELVHKAFAGYNAAVLAYGQTGTGKTYTMGTTGCDGSDAGILPRAIEEIFALADSRRDKMDVTLAVSFIEIYKEELKDLLNESGQPVIKEDRDGMVYIDGAEKKTVSCSQEMVRLLAKGGETRTTKETEMNTKSSRSHAIFIVFIDQKTSKKEAKEDMEAMSARFFFVDLAGSERIKKTKTTDEILKEGIKINLGLLELGNVISALSTKDDRRSQYISFRNSKLTRILQDCLGGNSNTYMIACIGPSDRNEDESISTLNYASKAKNIKNTPIVNRDPQAALLLKLQELTSQNKKLRLLLHQKGVTTEDIAQRELPELMEHAKLKEELKQIKKAMELLTQECKEYRARCDEMEITILETRREKGILELKLQLGQMGGKVKENGALGGTGDGAGDGAEGRAVSVVDKYLFQISQLQRAKRDAVGEARSLQEQVRSLERNGQRDEEMLVRKNVLIRRLAKENWQLKREVVEQEEEVQDLEMVESDEIVREEKVFAERERKAKEENEAIEREIRGKQLEIDEISREHSLMSSELVGYLRQENHTELIQLERNKQTILRKRDEALPHEQNKFTDKIDTIQKDLADCRAKLKKQEELKRMLQAKDHDISKKDSDLKALREEKKLLKKTNDQEKKIFKKQIKELQEKKKAELMVAKQENRKQINTIRTLSRNHQRSYLARIRAETELKKTKEKNNALRKKAIVNAKKLFNTSLSMENMVAKTIENLFEVMEEQKALQSQLQKLSKIEQEMSMLTTQDSKYRLQLQRLQLKSEQELSPQEILTKNEVTLLLNDLKDRISIAQQKLFSQRSIYEKMLKDTVHQCDPDAQLLQQQELNPDLQRLLDTFKGLTKTNESLLAQKQEREAELNALRQDIDSYRHEIQRLTFTFNNELRAREEAMARELMLREEYYMSKEQEGRHLKMDDKERRALDRQIAELTKNSKQLTQEAEHWRKKYQNVHDKHQLAKGNKSEKKSLLGNLNEMLEELDGKLKKNKEEEEEIYEKKEDNQWDCVAKIDGHSSSILSMALHSNILITTATKSLKIWNLQTKKIISDLSGLPFGGLVKCVFVDPEKRMMFTACEKIITVWDLITMEVQGTLRYHKDDVRTIHTCGDYLFSGGKGLGNNGSLLVWDMRKLNPVQPFQEKQKNQDIFSFASHKNMLYYGTRNHNVRRMNITTCEILPPFDPPHMDSVSSLAVVNDDLVSGSKDRYIKLWELEQCITKDTINPFNDHVTTMQSTGSPLSIFYAGSKEGQIKVLGVKNDKIETVGRVMAHTQAVNGVCPLIETNPLSFVTASADKTIKIWHPNKETNQNISLEYRV